MLKGTTSEPSPADQVEQLLTSLMPGRYDHYTQRLHAERQYPNLDALKEALIRIDDRLPKIKTSKTNVTTTTESNADNHAMMTTSIPNNVTVNNNSNQNNRRSNMQQQQRKAVPKHARNNPPVAKHNSNRNGNNRNNQAQQDNKDNIICFNCGKKGHRSTVCRNKKCKCENCGKTGHQTRFCHANKPNNSFDENVNRVSEFKEWNEANEPEEESAMLMNDDDYNHQVTQNKETEVIVDSGATVHVFMDEKIPLLHRSTPNISESSENKRLKLRGISGKPLRVTGSGYIKGIGKYFVVPEATSNLLSVSQLIENGKYHHLHW
jgi:hypothetical protein